MHAGVHGGFDADDLDVRLQRLGGDCDAGDQAAAADGDDEGIEVRLIGQHFERDGALAGDDVEVIERVDEDQAFLLAELEGVVLGLVEHQPFEDDPGAVVAGVFDLVEGGRLGHHDRRRDAEAAGMVGDALGMVTGRGGNHAAALFVVGQLGQLVERAALLEGRRILAVLELDPDIRAGNRRQGARMRQLRPLDVSFEDFGGGLHVGKRHKGVWRQGIGHGAGSG